MAAVPLTLRMIAHKLLPTQEETVHRVLQLLFNPSHALISAAVCFKTAAAKSSGSYKASRSEK